MEKIAFDVELSAIEDGTKIKVIKEVRTIFGLGLKEVFIGNLRLKMLWKKYLIH